MAIHGCIKIPWKPDVTFSNPYCHGKCPQILTVCTLMLLWKQPWCFRAMVHQLSELALVCNFRKNLSLFSCCLWSFSCPLLLSEFPSSAPATTGYSWCVPGSRGHPHVQPWNAFSNRSNLQVAFCEASLLAVSLASAAIPAWAVLSSAVTVKAGMRLGQYFSGRPPRKTWGVSGIGNG